MIRSIFVGRYCSYYALLSSFIGSILFILSDTDFCRGSILTLLSNMQYSPGLGSAHTQHYTEISVINTAYITQYANILGGSILLTHSTTQYFRGVDTTCTNNAQFFCRVGTVYTKRYAIYSGVDTAYTKQYAVFLEGGYFF